jgi:hypothetical protein
VLLAVFHSLGEHSLLQVELMVQRVLLRLADGRGVVSAEQQEAALEGILDLCRFVCSKGILRHAPGMCCWQVLQLCSNGISAATLFRHSPRRQPGFVHDIFVNCDCRIERSDLYADICALVSKTAFPVSQKSLGPLHHISLEALMALLGALSQGLSAPLPQLQPSDELPRCAGCICVVMVRAAAWLSAADPGSENCSTCARPPRFVDVWTPIANGDSPRLEQLQAACASGAPVESAAEHAATAGGSDLDSMRAAAFEKQVCCDGSRHQHQQPSHLGCPCPTAKGSPGGLAWPGPCQFLTDTDPLTHCPA